MSQFNIHWKGYPHHRLPRIRLASPHNRSLGGRSYVQFTALEGSLMPYSLPLEKARLQQRVRIRRKKNISLRPLGNNAITRRRSLRAVLESRLSGVENPQRGLGAPTCTSQPSNLHPSPSSNGVDSAEASSIPSPMTDGRDSSTISKYPVATLEPVDPKLPVQSTRRRSKASQRVERSQDQIVSIDEDYKNSVPGRASVLRSSRTHDPRLPVRSSSRRNKSKYSKHDAASQSHDIEEILKPARVKKQSVSANLSAEPGARGRVCSTSTQSTSVATKLSNLPSRTPSRLVALKKFCRGLERHLIAQEAVRKAGMSLSSVSSSTNSADTVGEFMPYIEEFQAAGLAVTSNQQRRPAVREPERETVRLPTKEDGDKEQTRNKETERISKVAQIVSHDRSSSVLSEDTTTSNRTIIVSSDCGNSNRIVASPAQTTSTQNVLLPWLRKSQGPSLPELILPSRLTASNNMSSCSESACEPCVTTIIHFSPSPLKRNGKKIEPDTSHGSLQSTDAEIISKDVQSVCGEIGNIVRPLVPERPSRLLAESKPEGHEFTKSSGKNAFGPLEAGSQSDQWISRKGKEGKAKLRNEPVRRSSRRKSPLRINSTSNTSARLYRVSAKLLSLERASQIDLLGSVSVPTEAATTVESKNLSSLRGPPATSPPPPATDRAGPYKLARQSPDISIQDQYGFETPSIFELALHDVVTGSRSLQDQFVKEERTIISHPASCSAQGNNSDPVKRSSAPYTAPWYSPHVSKAGTESSLGFATSEYRVSKYLADLRALEGLGVNTLVDRAKHTVRKRKIERDQRTRGYEYSYVQDHERVPVEQESKDRNKKRRHLRVDETGRREFLVAQMLGRREARACETVKERALAMGWRGRNVSAGY